MWEERFAVLRGFGRVRLVRDPSVSMRRLGESPPPVPSQFPSHSCRYIAKASKSSYPIRLARQCLGARVLLRGEFTVLRTTAAR